MIIVPIGFVDKLTLNKVLYEYANQCKYSTGIINETYDISALIADSLKLKKNFVLINFYFGYYNSEDETVYGVVGDELKSIPLKNQPNIKKLLVYKNPIKVCDENPLNILYLENNMKNYANSIAPTEIDDVGLTQKNINDIVAKIPPSPSGQDYATETSMIIPKESNKIYLRTKEIYDVFINIDKMKVNGKLIGGYHHKYLKYKHKYLNLRKMKLSNLH
jgi:hypothetical protein